MLLARLEADEDEPEPKRKSSFSGRTSVGLNRVRIGDPGGDPGGIIGDTL
jgi:hypothetical protein